MHTPSLAAGWRGRLPVLLLVCALVYFLTLPFYLADVLRLLFMVAWLVLGVGWWISFRSDVDAGFDVKVLLLAWGTWGGWALLSALWSVDAAYSLSVWSSEVLGGALLFCLGWLTARANPSVPAQSAKVVVLWLLAMWGGILSFGHWPTIHELFYPGIWGGEAYFAGGVLLFLPFLLLFMVESLRFRFGSVLAVCTFALYAVVVYLTVMRIMWLAFMLLLLLFTAALSVFMARNQWRRWAGVAVVVLLLCVGLFVSVSLQKPPSWSTPYAAPDVAGAFVHNERYAIWSFWWDKALRHPILGLGYGLYNPTNTYAHPTPPGFLPDMLTHAHNIMLDVLLQLGAVGLLLWSLMFAVLVWFFFKRLRSDGVWAAAGLILVVLPLVRNVTDETWFGNNALVWWALLGLWVGASSPQCDKKCHAVVVV